MCQGPVYKKDVNKSAIFFLVLLYQEYVQEKKVSIKYLKAKKYAVQHKG